MKNNFLSSHLMFGVILFFLHCSTNTNGVFENCEFKINECPESDIAIDLDSIIFRNLKPIKENVSHHEITLEIVLNVYNNTSNDVMFDIDNEDYSHFNFKGLVNNSIFNDTINFNSFRNPTSISINGNNSITILLGSYYFPFENFIGPGFNKESVPEIIESFEMVYKAMNGDSICISQDSNVVVYVKD